MKRQAKNEKDGPAERQRSVSKAKNRPTQAQERWLRRGLDQPGGKLPLFDKNGREISAQTIDVCIANHWAEPWFSNPIKPDWRVCRLTEDGRRAIEKDKG